MAALTEVKATLKKEVGPFSIGVWLLIIGGGLALGLVASRAFPGGPNELEQLDGPLGAGSTSGRLSGGGGGPSGVLLPDGSARNPEQTAPTSNAEWSQRAIAYLIGQGESGSTSTEVITAWLYGLRTLTDAEKRLVDDATRGVGVPPETVSPPPAGEPADPSEPDPIVSTGFDRDAFFASQRYPVTLPTAPVPIPAPAPAPAPAVQATPVPVATASPVPVAVAQKRQHKVVSGDTLSKIGRTYGVPWRSIYNANKALIGSNPNRIFPGQILVIP